MAPVIVQFYIELNRTRLTVLKCLMEKTDICKSWGETLDLH